MNRTALYGHRPSPRRDAANDATRPVVRQPLAKVATMRLGATPSAFDRRAVLLALAALPLSMPARAVDAVPPEVRAELPHSQLIGEGQLRFLGLPVYDVRLWAPDRSALSQPATALLALELQYARSLKGEAIAQHSLQQMRALQPIDPAHAQRWLAELRSIFPDVHSGDRITGIQQPGQASLFFVNGSLRGELRDAEFTRLFFGLWLSPRSSQPQLRASLLGHAQAGS